MPARLKLALELSSRFILAALYLITEEFISPFTRLIPRPQWNRILYPHKPDTVPIWLVACLSLVLPFIILICSHLMHRHYLKKKGLPTVAKPQIDRKFEISSRHHFLSADIIDLVSSYSLAILVNGIVTNFIKLLVGRPRPDFFNRCYPDVDIYNSLEVEAKLTEITKNISNLDCSQGQEFWQNLNIIKEGRKSFPSGHSSSAFAAFGFIAYYIWGKSLAFSRKGRSSGESWRFLIGTPTMFLALFIVISRTQDYRHHWEDVTVGSIIGLASAYICYRIYYPSLKSDLANLSYRQLRWMRECGLDPQNIGEVKTEKWQAKLYAIEKEMVPYV